MSEATFSTQTNPALVRIQPDIRRLIIWREFGNWNNPAFLYGSVRFGGFGVGWYLYICAYGPMHHEQWIIED